MVTRGKKKAPMLYLARKGSRPMDMQPIWGNNFKAWRVSYEEHLQRRAGTGQTAPDTGTASTPATSGSPCVRGSRVGALTHSAQHGVCATAMAAQSGSHTARDRPASFSSTPSADRFPSLEPHCAP